MPLCQMLDINNKSKVGMLCLKNRYNARLDLQDKGRAIKGLLVFNSLEFSEFRLTKKALPNVGINLTQMY